MHNVAIALAEKGYRVTGSDDEIFEPSRSRLAAKGLLPATEGWDPGRITSDLTAVILGMHAREDNPELLKAQELGIKIYSFPEFIYENSKDKQRIVIAGSHGKTTITAMIMHVLRYHKRDFDYLVGAQLAGFDTMCRISDTAPLLIVEGDEYLTSPLDREPKFLKYKHHMAIVSGIAWDHANVYPNENIYLRQFDHLADATPKSGVLIYNEEDPIATVVCGKQRTDVKALGYGVHKSVIRNGQTFLLADKGKEIAIPFFGAHNLSNVNAAKTLLQELAITADMFYEAIASFQGAKGRMERLASKGSQHIFRDFAHAPSKVEATVKAVKDQFPKDKVEAFFELHTFSSLSKSFISQYKDTANQADSLTVYYNPAVVAHKKLPPLAVEDVTTAFRHKNMRVVTDSTLIEGLVSEAFNRGSQVLLMSSGNYNGLDLVALAHRLTQS